MALSGAAARRYAEALYDLAAPEGAVAAYRGSLERLAAGIAGASLRALRDPSVPLAQRLRAVQAAAAGEPRAIAAVLAILVGRDRLALLPAIARAYADLVDRRAGIAKAKITTAVALDEAERRAFVARLERASGKKLRATFAVDGTLIAGAKVQVGDHLVDTSVRAQLGALRRQLAT